MKEYLFIPKALEKISERDFFTRTVSWSIRVFAALFALGALIGWFQIWKAVFDMNGAAILGGVLFQICFVIGAYMALHVLWIRAAQVEGLPVDDYAVIPILPVVLRMQGEVLASLAITMGLGKGLLQLFVDQTRLGDRTVSAIPGIGWEHNFLVGLFGGRDGISSFINAILHILGGAVGAVVWLVVFYLLAEAVMLLLGMARDLKKSAR